jgi:nitroreductase
MPVEHDASTESTAALFQSLIQSRRTVARWDNDGNAQIDTAFLSGALDRAILCARHAPNHKRTEPFRFVRMLHQHGGIEQLANICCHVTLQRKLPKDPEHAESLAASKRDKWASIPAYLVTLVDQSKRGEAEENEESTDHLGDYEELPFVPPRTERQLEDVSRIALVCTMASLLPA